MRPLEGMRVLDLTHVLAGPFTTFQLATLGAEVIKIEGPNCPDMTRIEGVVPELNEQLRGTYFMAQNAGKKAITLNLKSVEGREILRRLVATSDVLVENYTAGKMEELGLGYDALSLDNPELIYCSITGFGQTGPKRCHPAYDVVIQAYSGLMAANGTPETTPVRVGPPMVDYGTGAQAALSICAALLQRARTGRGQRIDVAMLDCALMLMCAFVTDTVKLDQPPEPHGNVHPRYAGYATYDTADGMLMLGAWTNRQLASALDVLGLSAEAADVRTAPRATIGDRRAKDAAAIAGILKTRTADHWEQAFNAAHVPAARVRTLDEALREAQVASRTVLQSPPSGLPASAPQRFPTAGFNYAHGSPALDRPPPALGEHTAEILGQLDYAEKDIERLRKARVV